MSVQKKIESIFLRSNGYAQTADILAAGIHFSYLKKLEQLGVITKIKRGYYRWEGMAYWGNDLSEIANLIPQGIFCLFSAAAFHELITYQPWQHHIAVERSVKIIGIPTDRIKVYFWSKPLLDFGIEIVNTPGGEIKITSVERTLCDLVKYRNKIGKDTMLEAIKTYLYHKKGRSIGILMDYARRLRVEKIIRPYLEIAI